MSSTAMSTLCKRPTVSMPLSTKQPLSSASGRSVLVRMQTAGNGCPTEVKNDDSSGRVPLSETTQKAFIWRQL